MEYRQLGRTGIRVSELSFGSWVTFHNQADVKLAVDLMAAAYDAGVNFFDNAEVYAGGKSEEVMGGANGAESGRDPGCGNAGHRGCVDDSGFRQ